MGNFEFNSKICKKRPKESQHAIKKLLDLAEK